MQLLKELDNKEIRKGIVKLTDQQKFDIKQFKDNIIDSDNITYKYRQYIQLVRYLNKALNITPKTKNERIHIDYKIANAKISKKDTIIFSLSTALICYSALKGYCPLYKSYDITKKGIKRKVQCYALKNELQYNTSILYKNRQYKQFKSLKAWQIARQFILIAKKHKGIKYIRINESGDLTLKNLKKLNVIADILKKYNVKVYTYTHNIEITKDQILSDNLTINSSNKNIKLGNRFLSYDRQKVKRIMQTKKDRKIIECIADCEKCKACTLVNNLTILCNIH